jgi:hypothetical protein
MSHTNFPITSKGVKVTKPGEGGGGVEVGCLTASVVEVEALYGDIKCKCGHTNKTKVNYF